MLLKRYKRRYRKYRQPTRMVFTTLIIGGAKSPENCPQLIGENKEKISNYLNNFEFEA